MTYIALATRTLSGPVTQVTFSSIPSTFRDLILVVSGTADPLSNFGVQFNSDTSSNYRTVAMTGNGSSPTSFSQTTTFALMGRLGPTHSVNILNIMDYSATNKHKTVLARGGPGNELVRASATRWNNNNAINRITVVFAALNAGTTLSLYGIAG